MTVPDDLVQAVHDATRAERRTRGRAVSPVRRELPDFIVSVLAAVPDGWAKIDGEWVEADYVATHDDNAQGGTRTWERGRD